MEQSARGIETIQGEGAAYSPNVPEDVFVLGSPRCSKKELKKEVRADAKELERAIDSA